MVRRGIEAALALALAGCVAPEVPPPPQRAIEAPGHHHYKAPSLQASPSAVEADSRLRRLERELRQLRDALP
jgi:hypothetical protein